MWNLTRSGIEPMSPQSLPLSHQGSLVLWSCQTFGGHTGECWNNIAHPASRLSAGAALASYSGGLHCRTSSRNVGFMCSPWALGHRLRICGTQVLVAQGLWNLSRRGIELLSSTLADGFLSTVPPGSPIMSTFCLHFLPVRIACNEGTFNRLNS